MWIPLGRLWGWVRGVAISVEELNRQQFLKEAADLVNCATCSTWT
jgi:hypothetical protein